MAQGASHDDRGSPGARVPVPMSQRLSGLVPPRQALQLLLGEVSFDDYRDGLHRRDPVVLRDRVLPLERAFEIISNYIVELTSLALNELGVASIDGVRDLHALADEGVIGRRLAEELVDVHRARNGLQHDYPDVRASIVYPACQEVVELVMPFARSYFRWLGSRGYAVPRV